MTKIFLGIFFCISLRNLSGQTLCEPFQVIGLAQYDVQWQSLFHECIKKKKPFPVDFKTMLLIGAGAGLTTLGLSLNDANEPTTALVAGLTIGYGPLLLKHFGGRILYALKRKK